MFVWSDPLFRIPLRGTVKDMSQGHGSVRFGTLLLGSSGASSSRVQATGPRRFDPKDLTL